MDPVMEQTQPAIESQPRHSMAFVAHSHAGCYPDAMTLPLTHAVRADPGGVQMRDALIAVRLAGRHAGCWDDSHVFTAVESNIDGGSTESLHGDLRSSPGRTPRAVSPKIRRPARSRKDSACIDDQHVK